MKVEFYFITGFAIGFEYADLDEGQYYVLDLGILRILFSNEED
jgi:hypothetical protein